MINLEELALCLSVMRMNSNYVDGTRLRDDILCHLPQLNTFYFSIDTGIVETRDNAVHSSKEEIQASFSGQPFRSVRVVIDVFGVERHRIHPYSTSCKLHSRCHIYSLPYHFSQYVLTSDCLPSEETFVKVHTLHMLHGRPFEHGFFRHISRSFPALEHLCITNDSPQEDGPSARATIRFDRLRRVDVTNAHPDYAAQFLVDRFCRVPRLQEVAVLSSSLLSVTDGFTSDATRLNCGQLKRLRILEPFVQPAHFRDYFPSL